MKSHTSFFNRVLLALASTLTLLLAACGGSTGPTTDTAPIFTTDANGSAITIPAKAPQRIISLGATDSEILAALDETDKVVGVDVTTNYPASMTTKQKISNADGYPNIEAIVALKPDLVLGFGGETKQYDLQLAGSGIPVVSLPITNLQGQLKVIQLVGQLTHTRAAADTLVASMQKRIDTVRQKVAGKPVVSTYMEVDYSTPGSPYVAGQGSFSDEMITLAGGKNIFGDTGSSNGGYPQVSDETVIGRNPQVIILTEDPNYGGNPALLYQRTAWSGILAVTNKRVYAINPDIIQRPGPRIVDGLEALLKALHPEVA